MKNKFSNLTFDKLSKLVCVVCVWVCGWCVVWCVCGGGEEGVWEKWVVCVGVRVGCEREKNREKKDKPKKKENLRNN